MGIVGLNNNIPLDCQVQGASQIHISRAFCGDSAGSLIKRVLSEKKGIQPVSSAHRRPQFPPVPAACPRRFDLLVSGTAKRAKASKTAKAVKKGAKPTAERSNKKAKVIVLMKRARDATLAEIGQTERLAAAHLPRASGPQRS